MKRRLFVRDFDPWNPNDVAVLRKMIESSSDPEAWEKFGIFLYCTEKDDYLEEAIGYLKKAADKGRIEAIGYLGDAYFKGLGVERNIKRGLELYERSADGGSVESMFSIGNEYLLGRNVECDYGKAFSYLKKASDLGSDRATNSLGMMYMCGLYVDKDIRTAKKLFGSSRRHGNRNAAHNLSLIKELGADYDYKSIFLEQTEPRDYNWEREKRMEKKTIDPLHR